jgi:hypothetical protein
MEPCRATERVPLRQMTDKSPWGIGRFARTSRHRLLVSSRRRRAEQPRRGRDSRGEAMGKGRGARRQSRHRRRAILAEASLAAEAAW